MSSTTMRPNRTEESTTEFWVSEDDFDAAQIITKRITYTLYQWLFRVMIMLGLMMVLTFLICVPIAVSLLCINMRIRRVIFRKRKYWDNKEFFDELVKKKVSEGAAKKKKKKGQLRGVALKEAQEAAIPIMRILNEEGRRNEERQRRDEDRERRERKKRSRLRRLMRHRREKARRKKRAAAKKDKEEASKEETTKESKKETSKKEGKPEKKPEEKSK